MSIKGEFGRQNLASKGRPADFRWARVSSFHTYYLDFPPRIRQNPKKKKTDDGEFVLELHMISQHQENKFMKGMNSQKGTGNRKMERAPVPGRR